MTVALENVLLEAFFPHLTRFTTDFSAAYLERELRTPPTTSAATVFLGDSVLWGYNVRPQDTAVARLAAMGCACVNLSYKASSPPNYYALALLMREHHVHANLAVLEIDQRVFQRANSAYATLHPAVAELAAPLLDDADRRTLLPGPARHDVASVFQRAATALSTVYAMRSDIHAVLYPDPDVVPLQKPSPDALFAEYDLTPLDEHNAGVTYLVKAIDELRGGGIRVLAFMTPTNHQLLHDYIDGPEYQSNVAYLTRIVTHHGARVANFDRAFPDADFYDSSHLKPAAQRRFAALLHDAIRS